MRNLRIPLPQEICVTPKQIFDFIDVEAHVKLEGLLKVGCHSFSVDKNGDIECYTDYGHHRGGEERKHLEPNSVDFETIKEAYSIIAARETLRKLILS